MRKLFNRSFFIGFVLATIFWLWITSEITIPEYTIERKTVCT
jgi:hypothetical protein